MNSVLNGFTFTISLLIKRFAVMGVRFFCFCNIFKQIPFFIKPVFQFINHKYCIRLRFVIKITNVVLDSMNTATCFISQIDVLRIYSCISTALNNFQWNFYFFKKAIISHAGVVVGNQNHFLKIGIFLYSFDNCFQIIFFRITTIAFCFYFTQ